MGTEPRKKPMRITSTHRVLIAYYLFWIPLLVLLFAILSMNGISWTRSLVLSVLMGLPFAAICGSTYYMCRAMPLRKSRFSTVLFSLLGTTALVSGAWVGMFYVGGVQSGWIPQESFGDLSGPLLAMGGACFVLSLVFHYLVIAVEHIRNAEADASNARTLAREAELKAIRANLNPHFLFNALNSIAALTGQNPGRAREMVLLLAGFFRKTLELGQRDRVSLAEELSLVEDYLQMEKVRFDDRMTVSVQVDEDCLDVSVPPLILQPLVENAVKHGVGKAIGAISVCIAGYRDRGRVWLDVSNDVDPGHTPAISDREKHGLAATEERLRLFYRGEGEMHVQRHEGRFTVTIGLPPGA